jgi:hypothetical protein
VLLCPRCPQPALHWPGKPVVDGRGGDGPRFVLHTNGELAVILWGSLLDRLGRFDHPFNQELLCPKSYLDLEFWRLLPAPP